MTPTTVDSHNSVTRGIIAIVCGVFLFSIADAFGKWFGMAGYHTTQIVFFRYLFGLLPVSLVVWHAGVSALKTRRPILHVIRGVLMFTALTLFFRGLRDVPLAEGIAVAFTAPLFVTALSAPVLGERVGPQRWTAVLLGFCGMLIMLRPGTGAFRPDSLFIIASAFCFASVMVFTRRFSRTETNAAMYAYSTTVAGLCTVPFLSFTWITPQPGHMWLFVILGMVGGTASFLMIVAYRNAPAAVNAPFDYTALLWSALWGWIVWQQAPGPMVWLGAALVVAAGLFITYRETADARDRARRADRPPRV